MSEQDCLFCKIINGNAAADVVYQDNRCVVIRDIHPLALTHVRAIAHGHIESLDDRSPIEAPRPGSNSGCFRRKSAHPFIHSITSSIPPSSPSEIGNAPLFASSLFPGVTFAFDRTKTGHQPALSASTAPAHVPPF